MLIGLLATAACAGEQAQNSWPELRTPHENLKQRYAAARSPLERRSVCIDAIDEGVIDRGAPVAVLDEIFGTAFSRKLPSASEGRRRDLVLFSPQSEPPPGPPTVASGYVGWYLAFEYDSNGLIQSYYLSNLHKGLSQRVDGKQPPAAEMFRESYAVAKSEVERREVCLRAIDEGVIQTFGPVKVSVIDTIFGTRLRADLPKRSEGTKIGFLDLSAGLSAAEPKGWFLAVEYAYDGSLSDYYVSNVRR